MRRRRLPKYGPTETGLDDWRVHIARTSGIPDGVLARYWKVRARTVRDARVGKTWKHVPTPPDTKPRQHLGDWGDDTS